MYVDYDLIFGRDKQLHFLIFASISLMLGFFIIIFSGKHSVKRRVQHLWLTLVTVGIAEEYRQFAVPNRSAELLDAVANMVGVTCGLLAPWMIAMIFERRIKSSFKSFSNYFIVILVLFIGLLFLNERAFVSL